MTDKPRQHRNVDRKIGTGLDSATKNVKDKRKRIKDTVRSGARHEVVDNAPKTFKFLGVDYELNPKNRKGIKSALIAMFRTLSRERELYEEDENAFTDISEWIATHFDLDENSPTVDETLLNKVKKIIEKFEETSVESRPKEEEDPMNENETESAEDQNVQLNEKAIKAARRAFIKSITKINSPSAYKRAMAQLTEEIERMEDGERRPDGLSKADLISAREAILEDTKRKIAANEEREKQRSNGANEEETNTPHDGNDTNDTGENGHLELEKLLRELELTPTEPSSDAPTNDDDLPAFHGRDIRHEVPYEDKFLNIPLALGSLIKSTAEGDSRKEDEMLKLWDVAQGKSSTGNPELDRRIGEELNTLEEAIESSEETELRKRLEALIESLEGKVVKELEKDQLNIREIKKFFEELSLVPAYAEVCRGITELLDLAEINPDSHPKYEKLLSSARRDLLSTILLDRFPIALGLEKANNIEALKKGVEEMGIIRLKNSLENLRKLLNEDEDLIVIKKIYEVVDGDEPRAPKSIPEKKKETLEGPYQSFLDAVKDDGEVYKKLTVVVKALEASPGNDPILKGLQNGVKTFFRKNPSAEDIKRSLKSGKSLLSTLYKRYQEKHARAA